MPTSGAAWPRCELRQLQLSVVLRTLQPAASTTLRQVRIPGEKLFVDYSGHIMEVVDEAEVGIVTGSPLQPLCN